MTCLDWLIVAIPLGIVLVISWQTRRHIHSVADFLTAGRVAGRYLVATSVGTAGFGAITAVMYFEIICRAGIIVPWWEIVLGPFGAIVLFLSISGFIIYRYRETRAMTLAQLFEKRYSRRFRILAGSLCFFSGLINFAIFPAVNARFFVNFIGLPQTVPILGYAFPTFGLLMPCFLGLALYTTLTGGQLTVMITDAVEGLISGVLYVIVGVALLLMFKWDAIFAALSSKGREIGLLDPSGVPVFGTPAGSKGNWLIDPFDSPSATADFNLWYVGIGAFLLVYCYMAWQGNQGFNCAAANPHEAKMGNILGSWRLFARNVLILLLGLCALTVLRAPEHSAEAGSILSYVRGIDEPQIRSQMLVPVALGHMLPVGIKGCFAAIMFFAMLASDGSYLHSWGSIFIQDVVMPLRSRPLTQGQHIRFLRWSITGVAIFIFLFSLFFKQTDAISLFFGVTGAIFGGGAGAAIIGGLYWRRGTTAGAWAAMLAGALTPIGGMCIQQMAAHCQRTHDLAGEEFWLRLITLPGGHVLTGREIAFVAALVAILAYIVLSLLTCRQPFDMEKLLHRGPHAVAGDQVAMVEVQGRTGRLGRALGWDRHFTRGDKFISGGLFLWSLASVLVVGGVTAWNLGVSRWTLPMWSRLWWYYMILIPLTIGTGVIAWLTWGVIHDMKRLFLVLRTPHNTDSDDNSPVDVTPNS
jgi:solute:Na+ symporter, SSS family